MVVKEQILTAMLEHFPGWAGSPEDFLEFITLTAYLSQADAALSGKGQINASAFAKELAAIFIKALGVSIAPYHDYDDLKSNCGVLKEDIHSKLERIVSKMKEDDAIFDLTESAGVMPSKGTIFDKLADDFRCQIVINKLRPHINFL